MNVYRKWKFDGESLLALPIKQHWFTKNELKRFTVLLRLVENLLS